MAELSTIDTLTVLNYQGSKKNLLSFLSDNIYPYVDPRKAFLDIFAGTSAVGYAFKKDFQIYANDAETYASIIAEALIKNNQKIDKYNTLQKMNEYYHKNFSMLLEAFYDSYHLEQTFLENKDYEQLTMLYKYYPVIWKKEYTGYNFYNGIIRSIDDLKKYKHDVPYMLFTTYYAQNYFGINQAMTIDSIRYAIEKISSPITKPILLTCLFYAMKECVFSKDGHMAQPLSIENNKMRLLKTRNKDVFQAFNKKLEDFSSTIFVTSNFENKVFNNDYNELLNNQDIKDNVGFIYIDPPYTDMQYSRYYHLLNTVALYDYPYISMYRGNVSKGLYRENRFQSNISKKSTALNEFEKLFYFTKENNINFAFSFAYPENLLLQPSNRYIATFEDIVIAAEKAYGSKNINVVSEKYQHSNNRNKVSKNVYEYLILGRY